MHLISTLLILGSLVLHATCLASPDDPAIKRGAYPFNHLVAFGDELSDNGNGS